MNSATYSPEDDKLRIYPAARLDQQTYERVRAKGYRWAPHQELFFAVWTPEAEDLALELADEINDEDKSLTDRAEERADRFEGYSDNRAEDAEAARRAVHAIADNIPLGQPILVGHHSEKRARRDAEKIENGMRRAVKMWETSEYWKHRASAAIRHAKYKELPAVRARRIKGLEKDERKFTGELEELANRRKRWEALGEDPDREKALALANVSGTYSAWSDLEANRKTPTEVRALVLGFVERYSPRVQRWLSHTRNRLEYERAMLAASGGIETDKTRPEVGGGVRCWATGRGRDCYSWVKKVNKVSVTVEDNWHNGNSANFTRTIPFDKCTAVISRAEVEAARARGCLVEMHDKTGFFIVDAPPDQEPTKEPETEAKPPQGSEIKPPDQQASFEAMRDSLRAGVKVVSAPQLFPTPAELAARMVELANIDPGERVLEPSAGTGNILRAIIACGTSCEKVLVEINHNLADQLRRLTPDPVICSDFLDIEAGALGIGGAFHKIIMNPPFKDGDDIKHIKHAMTMIEPGGRIVAICANGPRQQAALKPLAEGSGGLWEELPEGTFAGTGVRAVLAVFEEGPEASR